MADIELVIKIPEEDYDTLINHNNDSTTAMNARINLWKSLKNGKPLPKGHGRLIDADVFEKRLIDARLYYIGEKADDFDLRFAAGLKSAAERLVDAPTIIEADKEYEVEVITRGNCMMCGKELVDGLFFCKECENKANSRK